MDWIWEQFDLLVVFDTETTGIDFQKDQIIELGVITQDDAGTQREMDAFLRLPEGKTLPPFITQLTGITDEQLLREGISPEEAAEAFCALFSGAERPLIMAYNAQFDLNFLYRLLKKTGLPILRRSRFLDTLTVYKDRRDYPHKLSDAIAAYGLTEAVNSHRASDDAKAALLLMEAMEREKADLARYINLFGVHPKYGRNGSRISSIQYRVQPYDRRRPLYELG